MSVTPESVGQMLASEDFGDRLKGVNLLRDLDPGEALGMILPVTADSNTRVRYAAVSQMATLGEQDRETALHRLREVLKTDPEPDVKAAAADALGALKFKEAYDDLAEAYHLTQEWLLQFSIIAALGELGDARSFELLQEAIQSDNPLIKTAAIGSFGELGDPRAVEILAPFMNDPDWQVRMRLAQALGHLGGEKARELLEQLANDEAEQVVHEAKDAL